MKTFYKVLAALYVVFSIVVFGALVAHGSLFWGWMFGAFACGAPAFILDKIKTTEEPKEQK